MKSPEQCNVALLHGKRLYLQCLTNSTGSLALAAAGFFAESYKQGCADGAYWLAQCHERGFGVPASWSAALEKYQEGAYREKGSLLCMDKLGWYMIQKKGPASVHEEGYALVQRAMSRGDVLAMYHVARCYREGKGVEANEDEALKLEKKFFGRTVAFADGFQSDDVLRDADILYALARCFEDGRVVHRCFLTCVALLERASARGCSQAQFRLGSMYYFGRGVGRDEALGIELCRAAAIAGNIYAQTNLGILHRRGLGVGLDATRAVGLVGAAAGWGHSEAMVELAGCYEAGEGVERDVGKATELYERAGAAGDMKAMGKLSRMMVEAGERARRAAKGKVGRCGVRSADGGWLDRAALQEAGLFPVGQEVRDERVQVAKDAVWLCVCGECMEDMQVESFREWVRGRKSGAGTGVVAAGRKLGRWIPSVLGRKVT